MKTRQLKKWDKVKTDEWVYEFIKMDWMYAQWYKDWNYNEFCIWNFWELKKEWDFYIFA